MNSLLLRPAFFGICLLLMHFKLDSQPYQSLFSHGDSTTTWTHFAFNLSQANFATSRYEKDTVVHGLAYKKVVLMKPVTDGLFGPFSGGKPPSKYIFFSSLRGSRFTANSYI